MEGRRWVLGAGEGEQVDLLDLPGVHVLVVEVAVYHVLPRQARGHAVGLRQAEVLVVEEEEHPVLQDRAARVDAGLVQVQDIARQTVDGIEVVVRIEEGVAVLPDRAAVVGVGAALGDELHLRRAFPRALRAQRPRSKP